MYIYRKREKENTVNVCTVVEAATVEVRFLRSGVEDEGRRPGEQQLQFREPGACANSRTDRSYKCHGRPAFGVSRTPAATGEAKYTDTVETTLAAVNTVTIDSRRRTAGPANAAATGRDRSRRRLHNV